MQFVFHTHAKLIGDRRKITLETLVSDLEYADDIALLSSAWSDLEVMVKSLQDIALLWDLSTAKTKTLAVMPSASCPQPRPILLSPSEDPVKPVSTFQYLGSRVSQDCM